MMESAFAPEAVDLRSLVEHTVSVSAAMTVEAVQAEFVRTQVDFLAVLDGDILLGMCARRELDQALSSRFGFALNARRPISAHLMSAPLRVVTATPVTTVLQAIAARPDHDFYDDVMLTDEHNRYCGMIPMRTLTRLQTRLLLGNIARLESSRQEIAAKNLQMEQDLDMARSVQLAMMPQSLPPIAAGNLTLRLAHRFQPASGVSGDFFDAIRLSDHSVGILVCDVMGHGVRSALITAMVRAMLEEMRPIAAEPGALLTRLNSDLTRILRQTGGMIFVTAAYAVIHLGFSRLRYAQAGHPTPLRWDARSGAVRPFACSADSAGPALGLLDDFEYVATDEPLGAGDRLVFYTDGLFEAARPDGEEFGLERLRTALHEGAALPLGPALDALLANVTAFCRGAPFTDDVCIVAAELGAT
jgi:phosphoserine phosphatase RsbU/P